MTRKLPSRFEKERFARLVLEHQASLEGLSVEEAISKAPGSRKAVPVAVRMRVCKILRAIPHPDPPRADVKKLYTLEEVGKLIGRNHETVMYAEDAAIRLDHERRKKRQRRYQQYPYEGAQKFIRELRAL